MRRRAPASRPSPGRHGCAQTLVAASSIGLAEVDATTGRVVHGNAAFTRLLGLGDTPRAHALLSRCVLPDDGVRLRRLLARIVDGELDGSSLDVRLATPHRAPCWRRLTVDRLGAGLRQPPAVPVAVALQDVDDDRVTAACAALAGRQGGWIGTFDWSPGDGEPDAEGLLRALRPVGGIGSAMETAAGWPSRLGPLDRDRLSVGFRAALAGGHGPATQGVQVALERGGPVLHLACTVWRGVEGQPSRAVGVLMADAASGTRAGSAPAIARGAPSVDIRAADERWFP